MGFSKNFSAEVLAGEIRSGSRMHLAMGITLVESKLERDQEKAEQLLRLLFPSTGHSLRIGITGVPGVGKSTFIDSFGTHLTAEGHRVAVLAVDPSSRLTGGSILGDKTRMPRLATDPRAFIRPSPSDRSLGGVTRRTREAIWLCEAAGFDRILVETVGVGQSETEVHSMTDFFLLLMLAGAGDELQGIKKGIMEMADGIVINKADGDNVQRALRARAEFTSALQLFPHPENGWQVPVITASGLTGEGIGEIADMIDKFSDVNQASGHFAGRRRAQARTGFREALTALVEDYFWGAPGADSSLAEAESRAQEGMDPPTVLAAEFFRQWKPPGK